MSKQSDVEVHIDVTDKNVAFVIYKMRIDEELTTKIIRISNEVLKPRGYFLRTANTMSRT